MQIGAAEPDHAQAQFEFATPPPPARSSSSSSAAALAYRCVPEWSLPEQNIVDDVIETMTKLRRNQMWDGELEWIWQVRHVLVSDKRLLPWAQALDHTSREGSLYAPWSNRKTQMMRAELTVQLKKLEWARC